jgi:mannose-1-phosphate guanylyltransferase
MEHTSRGAVIPAEIGWSDVGDWNTLADVLHGQANADGNVVRGQHIGLDTERSIIYNTTTTLIATIGLEDMIIVHAGDVILICPRARHQDVRALVERLKYDKKESYL